MRSIFSLLVVVLLAGTTAAEELADQLASQRAALARAEAECWAALKASLKYQAAVKDLAAKENRLEAARTTGNSAELARATASIARAKTVINQMESDARAEDTAVALAEARIRVLEKMLADRGELPADPVDPPVTTKPVQGMQTLVLQDGAPAAVKDWFDSLATRAAKYKQDQHLLLGAQYEAAELAAQRFREGAEAQYDEAIAAAQQKLEEIRNRKVGKVRTGTGGSETDMKALNRKGKDLKAQSEELRRLQREKIAVLKGVASPDVHAWTGSDQVATLVSEYRRAKAAVEGFEKDDRPAEVIMWTTGHAVPEVETLRIGSWGRLPGSLRVFQVVSGHELIVDVGGQLLWLDGFDTESIREGQNVTYAKSIRIDKLKRYTTLVGTSRTVFLAEPFPVEDYVIVVGDAG